MKRLTLLFLLALSLVVSAAPAAKKPNILWIFVEDLSPWMASYGFPVNAGKTPTLDKLTTSELYTELAAILARGYLRLTQIAPDCAIFGQTELDLRAKESPHRDGHDGDPRCPTTPA